MIKRRITTNGKLFRIEMKVYPIAPWSPYSIDYNTYEEAKEGLAKKEQWDREDEARKSEIWREVQ